MDAPRASDRRVTRANAPKTWRSPSCKLSRRLKSRPVVTAMASDQPPVGRVPADRFARLKALQRPLLSPQATGDLPEKHYSYCSASAPGSDRLALLLGAVVKSNSEG